MVTAISVRLFDRNRSRLFPRGAKQRTLFSNGHTDMKKSLPEKGPPSNSEGIHG
jgi:hypothetical protein